MCEMLGFCVPLQQGQRRRAIGKGGGGKVGAEVGKIMRGCVRKESNRGSGAEKDSRQTTQFFFAVQERSVECSMLQRVNIGDARTAIAVSKR